MKTYGVFIDLRNAKQIHWWNKVNIFVKAIGYNDIIETATNKSIGRIFQITGPFAKRIASRNVQLFIKNPVEFKYK